jgi:uncharacterized protein (DUF952 family)
MTRTLLVKIFTSDDWFRFRDTGEFSGSADDPRDGFIHLSLAHQVEGTLERHFAGAGEIVVAEIAVEQGAVSMEVSRAGERFPHLYRSLTLEDVVWSGEMRAWRSRQANT